MAEVEEELKDMSEMLLISNVVVVGVSSTGSDGGDRVDENDMVACRFTRLLGWSVAMMMLSTAQTRNDKTFDKARISVPSLAKRHTLDKQ